MSESVFLRQGFRLEVYFEHHYPAADRLILSEKLSVNLNSAAVEANERCIVVELSELTSSFFEPLLNVIHSILGHLSAANISHSLATVLFESDCPILPIYFPPQLLNSLSAINCAVTLDINANLAGSPPSPIPDRSDAYLLVDCEHCSEDEVRSILGDPDLINNRHIRGSGQAEYKTLWYGGEDEELHPAIMLEELVEEFWLTACDESFQELKSDSEWRVGWFLKSDAPAPLLFEINEENIRHIAASELPLYLGIYLGA